MKRDCFSVLLAFALIAIAGPSHAESRRAEFVYVSYGSAILSYALNSNTGSIAPLAGSPLAIAGGVGSLVVDRAGRFLYAETGDTNVISGYRIQPNGSLAPLAGSPFKIPGGPFALDPFGRFLYAADFVEAGTVSVQRIDANGALHPVPGSPFQSGSYPSSITVDPLGRFVYVANFGSENVSAYRVLENGALVAVGGSPSHGLPITAVVEGSGRFVYVANFGASTISSYLIGPNGGLTPLAGSPTLVPGVYIQDMALDPLGGFLYIAQGTARDNVWAYHINSTTGMLETVPGSPFDGGVEAFAVAVDPLRKFVYVGNANHLADKGPVILSAYRKSPNGALKPVPGSPFPVSVPDGTFPYSIAIAPSGF